MTIRASTIYDCPSYIANYTDYHRVFYACLPPRSHHFNDTANQSPPYEDAYPVFKLPGLALREVVDIQLDFISQSTTATNNRFKIELLDSGGNVELVVGIFDPIHGFVLFQIVLELPYHTFRFRALSS